MNATIVMQEITKIYPNGTCAVQGIDLAADSKDLTVILGPSGAGKSTLLRCMNRLLEPTSGHLHLNGEEITHAAGRKLQEVRKRVGMIFQQFNLVRRLTVLENVLAGRLPHCNRGFRRGLSLLKIFSGKDRELAFECLKKVKIEHLAYQRADTLSGGQQQRVAIARALAQGPYVFLADEPVASLDPASAETVMKTLQAINHTQKIPVIVNLHQIELAERYATRIIGMARGRVVFDGPTASLTDEIITRIYGTAVDRRNKRAMDAAIGEKSPEKVTTLPRKRTTNMDRPEPEPERVRAGR